MKDFIDYTVNFNLYEKLFSNFYKQAIKSSLFKFEKIVLNFNIDSDSLINNPFSFYTHCMHLELFTGQKLKFIRSKKHINEFNLRKKYLFGGIITLRNNNMVDFLKKLILLNQFEIYNYKGLVSNHVSNSRTLSFGFRNLDSIESVFTTFEKWAFLPDNLRYGYNLHIVNNYKYDNINQIALSHLGFFFL